MKKCQNCGTENPDSNNYCSNCGQKLEEEVKVQDFTEEDNIKEDKFKEDKKQKTQFNKKSKPFKRKNKNDKYKTIGIIVIVAIICILGIRKYMYGRANPFIPTIDIGECIHEPRYEGNDGEGEIKSDTLYIDEDLLEKRLEEAIKDEDNYVSASSVTRELILHPDKEDNLSNGDKINVVIEINNRDNLQNELGVRFTNPSKEFTVTGLTTIKEIDPFEDLKVSFTGISPRLKIELRNKNLKEEDLTNFLLGNTSYYYDIYKNGKLTDKDTYYKIGDTVTLKINKDGKDELKYNAYEANPDEKDYSIGKKDASSYIRSIDELNDEFKKEIEDQADSLVRSYLASNSNSEPYKYLGIYFLDPKDSSWEDPDSYSEDIPIMYLVYSYNEKYKDENKVKYLAVSIKDFINKKVNDDLIDEQSDESNDSEDKSSNEDESSNEENIETTEDDSEIIQSVNYKNIKKEYSDYDSLKELFLDLVESKADTYKYEMTQSLEDNE